MNLINKNTKTVNNLVNGRTSTSLQYNTDVVFGSTGIEIDKSVPNKIKITNKNQLYNVNSIYSFTVATGAYDKTEQYVNTSELTESNLFDLNATSIKGYIKLKEYTNYISVFTDRDPLSNINIYINDTDFKFKTGQVIRMVFPNRFILGSNQINFHSDTLDTFGDGTNYYNKLLGTITAIDLLNLTSVNSANPILELVCVDSSTYKFRIDIIR